MTIGVAAFATWYFTRLGFLMLVGIFTIYLGVVCVIAGLIALLVYEYRCLRAGDKPDAKKGVFPLVVMLLNFPLAILIVSVSLNLMARYTVTVVNETGFDVNNISFVGPDIEVDTGPVKSQKSRTVTMRFETAGSLRYHGSFNAQEVDGIVAAYVAKNRGGNTLLIIREDSIEIKRRK